MATPRLLALDVDGTLLRDDGTIAPADREAIARARADGLTVTLATGRLSSSTLPFARELALDAPLVCADGAVVFCPVETAPLALTPLPTRALAALLDCLRGVGLAPFLFTHGAVHGGPQDAARFPWIGGWTPDLVACDALDALAERDDIITAIGVGAEEPVHAAERALRAQPGLVEDVVTFPIRTTPHWVVRLTPRGCTKALGLEAVCARLGLEPAQVAVVGDWYNDVPMMTWAGFSFAMGQAPDDVRQAARWTLSATAVRGGGVAEALQRLRLLR